jgi:hypothetical protein
VRFIMIIFFFLTPKKLGSKGNCYDDILVVVISCVCV